MLRRRRTAGIVSLLGGVMLLAACNLPDRGQPPTLSTTTTTALTTTTTAPTPALEVYFTPTSDPAYCGINIRVTGFQPSTTYPVSLAGFDAEGRLLAGFDRDPITTDAQGSYEGFVASLIAPPYKFVSVTVGDVTAQSVPIPDNCAAL